MDKVVNQLCHELEKRFIDGSNAGKTFDLGQWILYCERWVPWVFQGQSAVTNRAYQIPGMWLAL